MEIVELHLDARLQTCHAERGTAVNKARENEAVELTQNVLARFWQLDCEYVLSLCTDDVMWIAPEQNRYMRGIDAVTKDLLSNREELVPCHQSNAEYTVVQNCGHAISIVGRYLVSTDDGVPYFLQVQQHCQFTWELIDDALKIRSLYVSNPRGELAVDNGESFVNALGQMASRYMEARIALKSDHRRVVFADDEGATRFVPYADIISVSADGKHCIVHSLRGDHEAKMSISQMRAKLGSDFIATHRSYLVNVHYVAVVKPYLVELADNRQVPISQRRYAEVRDAIIRAHE